MALSWDTELFTVFHAKRINNKLDLVVGQSYPSNMSEHTVKITEDVESFCNNFNVGGLFGTPWLLFANEQDAKDCREQMEVRFVQEEYATPVHQ